eukprot:UN02033
MTIIKLPRNISPSPISFPSRRILRFMYEFQITLLSISFHSVLPVSVALAEIVIIIYSTYPWCSMFETFIM